MTTSAFLSYTRDDDKAHNGLITQLQEKLELDIKIVTGEKVEIFIDTGDIDLGEEWRRKLENAIQSARFFIPVITPSFFNSEHCLSELERFERLEKQASRNDLILPIYLVRTSLLEDEERRIGHRAAELIASRQRADWRDLHPKPLDSEDGQRLVRGMAEEIEKVLERTPALPASAMPLQNRIDRLEEERGSLLADLESLRNRQASGGDRIGRLERELEAAKGELEHNVAHIAELREALEAAERDAATNAGLGQTVEALRAKAETAAAERARLDEALAAANAHREAAEKTRVEIENGGKLVLGRGKLAASVAVVGLLGVLSGWTLSGAGFGTQSGQNDVRFRVEPAAGDDYPVGKVFRDCADCPEMVVLPSGSYMRGSPEDEKSRNDDEGPLREVTIGYKYAVGRFEVTFDEWLACMDGGGCGREVPDDRGWGRGSRPVINVSWNQAQDYVAWLSRETGATYRLLSEAEWEYAARAGAQTPFHFGETISTDQANYDGDFTYGAGKKGEDRKRTVPVGSFPPNDFGLFDMHGNVWEWVRDCYVKSYEDVPNNGEAFGIGQCAARVVRGGSWDSLPDYLRSAVRSRNEPSVRNLILGFRVARTLTP